MRDDFSPKVKRLLGTRVGFICSNPDCLRGTCGPSDEPASSVNVGVASHITAASPGGPRYEPAMSDDERSDISNGIWLCWSCSKLIDDDVTTYSICKLLDWRAAAERRAHTAIAKPLDAVAVQTDDVDLLIGTEDSTFDILHGHIELPSLQDALVQPTIAYEILLRTTCKMDLPHPDIYQFACNAEDAALFAASRRLLAKYQVSSVNLGVGYSPVSMVSWRQLTEASLVFPPGVWASVGAANPDEPIFKYDFVSPGCGGDGTEPYYEEVYAPTVRGMFAWLRSEEVQKFDSVEFGIVRRRDNEISRYDEAAEASVVRLTIPTSAKRRKLPVLLPLCALLSTGRMGPEEAIESHNYGGHYDSLNRSGCFVSPRVLGSYLVPMALLQDELRTVISPVKGRQFAYISRSYMMGCCPLLRIRRHGRWEDHGHVLVGSHAKPGTTRVVVPAGVDAIELCEQDDEYSMITGLRFDGLNELIAPDAPVRIAHGQATQWPVWIDNDSILNIEGWFFARDVAKHRAEAGLHRHT